MTTARDTIVDALDIESFVLCESEQEAKDLILSLPGTEAYISQKAVEQLQNDGAKS